MLKLYLVGTADTKFAELEYLKNILVKSDIPIIWVDLSTTVHSFDCDISANEVAGYHRHGADAVLAGSDRGKAVAAMGEAFAAYCKANLSQIGGIIGIGGGGGTSMISAGMRELPYGIPKIIVSTLASGDTSPFVDTSDIIMMPSVTDIAGLNFLSRIILTNAANAISGMVAAAPVEGNSNIKTIGMSMFGVTTPAVTHLVHLVDQQVPKQYEAMVFHATGTGGRTMEKLLLEGHLEGLIDLTTTEIADHVCGGVLSAGPGRLDAVAETRAPYVGAPGALDMVNFWAPDTIPDQFADRHFYHHNANVTLMRTTPQECKKIGKWLAAKLNACEGEVRFLIPEKGLSALDIEGGDFWLRESDEALFDALEANLKISSKRKLVRLPLHINDPEFSAAALEQYLEIAPQS